MSRQGPLVYYIFRIVYGQLNLPDFILCIGDSKSQSQMRPNRLQINPLFDTELDQWLFVGELRRSIYISPVGDYDFDGIDTTEFTVGDKSALNLSSVKCHQFLSETTFSRQQKRCSISLHRRTSASVPTRSPGHQTTTYDCVLSSAHLSLRGCAKLVVAASGSRDSRNLFIEICTAEYTA